MLLRIAAAFTLLLVVLVRPVDACSCALTGPPCEATWKTAAVVAGEVVEIAPFRLQVEPGKVPPPLGALRVSIKVDRTYHGTVPELVEVHTGEGDADCGFPFRVGERYLVYAHPIAGRLQASVCSRTRRLVDAAEDLTYLEELAKPSPGGQVFGTVTTGGDDRRPMPGIRVRLGNEGGERSTITNGEGAFEFRFLPAGGYGIQPDVAETHRVHGPPYLEIRDPRGCAAADFTIVPDGRISLFVFGPDGRPAKRLGFELIRGEDLHAGKRRAQIATLIGDGPVVWTGVQPGRYVIGSAITRAPHPDRPQPSLFYPGTPDPAGAFGFEVGIGEQIELDTWRLPPPPAAVRMPGVVVDEDGARSRAQQKR